MTRIKKNIKLNKVQNNSTKIPLLIKEKFVPRGCLQLPGDKSIAHRALILSALCSGLTKLNNFPLHDDALATLNALAALGVKISRQEHTVRVQGCGLNGLKAARRPVFMHNSGTTLRLLLGVLAGLHSQTKVIAGKELSRRPMSRVNVPLRLMGASIKAKIKNKEEYAPLLITGGRLKGITYKLPVASAQVKSAILLAGLFAQGKTEVLEKSPTRDHTERMFKLFGANLATQHNKITLNPNRQLVTPGQVYIPGDISSAAFFLVWAAIVPQAQVTIKHSSLNPSRMGLVNVLRRMQAKIKIKIDRSAKFEPQGEITSASSKLRGTTVYPGEIPFIIDELPILMVAACFAGGRTIIKGVGELRVKESDRINAMLVNLKKMGADIQVVKEKGVENIIICGDGKLRGAQLRSFADHRIAMSMVVAAQAAAGRSRLDDARCISKSFPDFLATLNSFKLR